MLTHKKNLGIIAFSFFLSFLRNTTSGGGPQATEKRIMGAVGSADICTRDMRLGMPAVKNSDYVGDLKRANTMSPSFGNVKKGISPGQVFPTEKGKVLDAKTPNGPTGKSTSDTVT